MPTKSRVLLWVLGAILLSAASWYIFGLIKEPRYAGRRLSDWVREYSKPNLPRWESERKDEAAVAIRKMGTNALPYLLDQVLASTEDSIFRTSYYDFLGLFPKSWELPHFVSREQRCWEAAQAISEMRPPAHAILPRLDRALGETNEPAHTIALFILGSTGEDAETVVPILVKALHDPERQSRGEAANSLRRLGPRARAAIPDLMEMLKSNDAIPVRRGFRTRVYAARALGSMGSNAAPALPLLQAAFERETNWLPRASVAATLCKIDARETNALDFLINGLKGSPEPNQSQFVVRQLGDIGPNAIAAAPALLEELRKPDSNVWPQVPEALRKMGVEPGMILALLKERLKSRNDTERATAAAGMLAIHPEDQDAQATLLRLIVDKSGYEGYAIEQLGLAGPAAQSALPVLRELAKNKSSEHRKAANKALKQIEAGPKPVPLPN